jgi:uncharacterized protein YndB with AHSA1/START domain
MSEIVLRRVFTAPPERVWAAWTEPDQLAAWWGKRGWSIDPATLVMDVRPGGAFRHVSVHAETGETMLHDSVYTAVEPPTRLAFSQGEVTFTRLADGGTEMVFRAITDLSEPVRQRAVVGLGSAFDRLAELVHHHTPEQEHA